MIDNLLLTAAQMRALETAAIDSGAVTGLELMERAGLGAVDAILEEWPQMASAPGRAVVLCGPGNNGGDGFVVARLLAGKGWDVDVFLYGNAAKLPPDARVNYKRWSQMGEVRAWDDHRIAELIDGLAGGLVVDALFGTGLSRPMPDDTQRTWHAFMPDAILARHAFGARHFVALDIPSGLCADSGRNLEGAFPAQLTVAFGARKIGHVLDPVTSPAGGASWCGRLRVVDLGLDRFLDAIDSVGPRVAPQPSVDIIAALVRTPAGPNFNPGPPPPVPSTHLNRRQTQGDAPVRRHTQVYATQRDRCKSVYRGPQEGAHQPRDGPKARRDGTRACAAGVRDDWAARAR